MRPRNWLHVSAWSLLAVQTGCQLQQAGPAPLVHPAPRAATPVSRPVATAPRPAPYEEEPSYGLMAIDHSAPSPSQPRGISPEDALKKSVMQEMPTGTLHLTGGPILSIETPAGEQLLPVRSVPADTVGGVQVGLNSVRTEATAKTTPLKSAPPMPTVQRSIVSPEPVAPRVQTVAASGVSTLVLPATRTATPEPSPAVQAAPNTPAPKTPDKPVSTPPEKAAAPKTESVPPPAPLPQQPAESRPLSPAEVRQLSPHTLLNSTNITLNYRIGKVGPSGIGKVEVWVTNDDGNTWQRLGEDFDQRTPAEIQLPGEGVWGIRLVAINGNGFGGTAPKRGERPSFALEVDTTCPRVALGTIEPGEGQVLDIRWSAQDINLGAAPVSIYYRTQPNQPWQLVDARLPNSGQHRWQFPREQPQFYFRIQVVDEAGNMASCESPTAVSVDMTVPHLSVVGVSGASKR